MYLDRIALLTKQSKLKNVSISTAWNELVQEGVNGCGFVTSDDLVRTLERLFGDTNGKELATLRKGAVKEGSRRWDDEWNGVAGRLLGLCE
ncbi:putative Chitobiosyldiphosphodolichol beta-mannosyltransferase [Glarea lozoyensis 74030]|uniref:Putative Chitobiosyldiphosphodolichol beta-mannosyltransferase n=1 Tax=Glarea lozoyensis (strain ATCC 74030 / MF5533) TaxID=1104152 RepID=H0EVY9_GLAL7|nr:putative Chitobiosyldiphosphodolichol beta-mannosyltransferase [Glarea lozoyensis 74030]